MKTAFLFPGQGAQHVGMGKDIVDRPGVADLFDRAEDATGLPLRTLCFEGPDEELARTDVAQPAIFTVSAAMLAAMEQSLSPDCVGQLRPEYCAGLSLGEYTALYAADALDFDDMVRLVARRGELMQQAATARPSGMVSIIGLDEPAAAGLCEAAGEGEPLSCANFNCPGQIVLSGAAGAVQRAADLAEEHGARGAVVLNVAGAFHSELMAPAADAFAETLDAVAWRDPKTPVVSNVDARPYDSADAINAKLLAQLTSPVRWAGCMEFLRDQQVAAFYEIGPGRVLAGLMRRIDRRADFTCVNSADSLEKLCEGDPGATGSGPQGE